MCLRQGSYLHRFIYQRKYILSQIAPLLHLYSSATGTSLIEQYLNNVFKEIHFFVGVSPNLYLQLQFRSRIMKNC